MANPAIAQVIPFPARQTHSPGSDRLNTTLDTLCDALAAQQDAVTEWRGTLDELRGALLGLGNATLSYRQRLSALDQEIGQLHGQTRRLERWADTLMELR